MPSPRLLRFIPVDLPYRELPDDIEIVENAQGRFEAKSRTEPTARFGWSQPTPELARTAYLTTLNVRAAMDRARDSMREADTGGPAGFTRERYERACAEVGILRLPDSVCLSLERRSFEAPDYDAETIVTARLADARGSAIRAEERRQHKEFERDLNAMPGFRGLSRDRYEALCDLVGTEPAAEDQITSLKVQCFQQEEVRGVVEVPLILAKWRDTGQYYERRDGTTVDM
ncbi:hypothetical protein [Actinoallomurus iriomotensis]|uniref:Uncharacterized protein n=1 Tax=Actinoallomurus iriomotensis TaxID=478107 RepID=A0A9W6RUD7_9ACTN|nr:hypothetical protein [Actinoallomurus iriomotensis]GLY82009.1 hypothetical protein Airi01_102760 [Actinoallomurus iriomotensis]